MSLLYLLGRPASRDIPSSRRIVKTANAFVLRDDPKHSLDTTVGSLMNFITSEWQVTKPAVIPDVETEHAGS